MDRSQKLREFYARYLTRLADVKNSQVEQAFASVSRERFVGPAPWYIFVGRGLGYLPTPDDDPAFLYGNHLIALDRERGVNNGQPSLHANCMDALSLRKGQDILHVGAGTGYYSAILAELVGRTGHVQAFEIDPGLAARATQNLGDWPWVTVHPRSGTAPGLPEVDVIYVNAGSVRPSPAWLDALRPGGELLFPLQPAQIGAGWGAMLLLRKPQHGAVWPARFVCRAGFIPCQDTEKDELLEKSLAKAFADETWRRVKAFHRNTAPDDSCWLKADNWWLSTRE